MLYRELTASEKKDFRRWARENHKPGDPINETWHPIVISECAIMDAESPPPTLQVADLPIGTKVRNLHGLEFVLADRFEREGTTVVQFETDWNTTLVPQNDAQAFFDTSQMEVISDQ
jgi:hypothetical protein